MKSNWNLTQTHVLLYGMGVTGRSAVEVLTQEGCQITVTVDGTLSEEDRDFLSQWSPAVHISEAPVEDFSSFDFVLRASGIAPTKPLIVSARAAGLPVWTDLEIAYRLYGGQNMIAITGSNGKTTTTSLVTHLLRSAGFEAEACGNIGTPVLTTMAKASEETMIVLECSSFQLEGAEQFAPHRAAILNITPDHLEWHGSYEAYADAKANIAHAQSGSDVLWIHPDDQETEEALMRVPTVAMKHVVDFSAPIPSRLRRGEGWHLFGEYNVENAAFAVAILQDLQVPDDVILAGLESFRAIAHRMEDLGEVEGVRYINDSKGTNVDSTVRALSGLDQPVLLIAGGYDKHVPFDDLFLAFQRNGKKLILMGATGPKLQEQAASFGLSEKTILRHTLQEAMEVARREAARGDIVLLSPASASWDQYNHFEERGDEFRAIVEAWRNETDPT